MAPPQHSTTEAQSGSPCHSSVSMPRMVNTSTWRSPGATSTSCTASGSSRSSGRSGAAPTRATLVPGGDDPAVPDADALLAEQRRLADLLAGRQPPGARDHPPPRDVLVRGGEDPADRPGRAGVTRLLGRLAVAHDLPGPEPPEDGKDLGLEAHDAS